jgi:hypothetical protein
VRQQARETAAQSAIEGLLPDQGRLRAAVVSASEMADEYVNLTVAKRATLDQHTVSLRTALQRYSQADLAQAYEIFERAGEEGGSVAAARDLLRRRRTVVADMRRNVTQARDMAFRALSLVFSEEKNPLAVFRPEFSDTEQQARLVEPTESRQVNAHDLLQSLNRTLSDQEQVATTQENELYEKYFLGDVSVKVRERIAEAQTLVKEIGATLERMTLSNGAHFVLSWQAKSGGVAGPEYTRLVKLVQWDPDAMTGATRKEMIDLFRGRVERARAELLKKGTGSLADQLQKELDYRAWFEFKLTFVKIDGTRLALEKSGLSKLSGGEQSLAQILPLLSAVHAYSESGRHDAPRLVYFDEAFVGVDQANTDGALRILRDLDFSWIFTSDRFWGTSRNITASATYTLKPLRQAVMAMLHIWDGTRKMTERDLAKHVGKHGEIPMTTRSLGRTTESGGIGGVVGAVWRGTHDRSPVGEVGSIAARDGESVEVREHGGNEPSPNGLPR